MKYSSITLPVCSSVSSSLSGAAANCWDDILKLKLSGLSELKKAFINRLLGMYDTIVYKPLFRSRMRHISSFTLTNHTRKLCYRNDDRAIRPILGCLKIFWTP